MKTLGSRWPKLRVVVAVNLSAACLRFCCLILMDCWLARRSPRWNSGLHQADQALIRFTDPEDIIVSRIVSRTTGKKYGRRLQQTKSTSRHQRNRVRSRWRRRRRLPGLRSVGIYWASIRMSFKISSRHCCAQSVITFPGWHPQVQTLASISSLTTTHLAHPDPGSRFKLSGAPIR